MALGAAAEKEQAGAGEEHGRRHASWRSGRPARPGGRRPTAPAWIAVVGLAAAATVAAIVGTTTGGPGKADASAVGSHHSVALVSTGCTGPAGTLFVVETGYDALGTIDSGTCAYTGTYNVGDPKADNTPTDTDYASTDEAVAQVGNKLYFADAGLDTVAVITSAWFASPPTGTYTPPETLVTVGFNPEDLAATPDGSQVWVTDTGPQTGTTGAQLGTYGQTNDGRGNSGDSQGTIPFTAVTMITTSNNTVVGTLQLNTAPQAIAFSPSGQTAYVTTSSNQLLAIDVATRRIVGQVDGLDGAHGVTVSPNGQSVYVTDATADTVSVIDAATLRVVRTIGVGQLPWTVALSPNGATAYVANPSSDTVSVIDTSSDRVVTTISVPEGPRSLLVSPTGTTLWVGEGEGSHVDVVTLSRNAITDRVELGFGTPNAGDGLDPNSLAFIAS